MFCHVLIKYTYFNLLTNMLKYLKYKNVLLADSPFKVNIF